MLLCKSVGRPTKCSVNVDFFRSWNPTMAYWFGFMCADGCVYNTPKNSQYATNIALKCSDLPHIQKFATASQSNYAISMRLKRSSTEHPENLYCAVYHTITNNSFSESLMHLGCIPNKSKYLKWPAIIPQELLSHFARGYFDGDGCLAIGKSGTIVQIAGTQHFCEGLRNTIVENAKGMNGFGSFNVRKDTPLWLLTYCGNQTPMALLHWI